MSLSDYGENAALAALLALGTYVQLHTADPGEVGTTAVSANTARNAITFGAPSGGVATWTGSLTWTAWPAPADGQTVTHFSIWTSGTPGAGNCLGSGAFAPSQLMNTGQTFKITFLTWSLD